MSAADVTAATIAAVKSGPPVTVSTLLLLGMPLEQWVLIVTLAWLAIQILTHLWKFFKGPADE